MMKNLTLLLVVPVALGFALGALSRSRTAHACECAIPTYDLTRTSVQSSDPAVDHTKFWPARPDLWGTTDEYYLEMDPWDGQALSSVTLTQVP
jgi:hypothetical protein